MAYIKGFDKSEIKNRPIGRGQFKREILGKMSGSYRGVVRKIAEEMGTEPQHVHAIVDPLLKKKNFKSRRTAEEIQKAILARFQKKGMSQERIDTNIRISRQLQKKDKYQTFAQELKAKRNRSQEEVEIDAKIQGGISSNQKATVTSYKSPIPGFAGESEKSEKSPVRPIDKGTIGIAGPVRK